MVGSNRGSSGNNKRKVFRIRWEKVSFRKKSCQGRRPLRPFARKVAGDAVPCVLSQEKLSGTPSLASFRKKSCRGRRPLRPFARKVAGDAVPTNFSRDLGLGTEGKRKPNILLPFPHHLRYFFRQNKQDYSRASTHGDEEHKEIVERGHLVT